MSKNIQTNSDEINIIDLLQIIWEGKWKIVVFTFIAAISIFIYQTKESKIFTAKTDIVPITTYEASKFDSLIFNDDTDKDNIEFDEYNVPLTLSTFKVSREDLLIYYVEILNEKSLFKEALDKFKYLNISNYSNEQDYDEALNLLTSSIKIIIEPQAKRKKDIEFTVSINFSHDDEEKWKNLLKYVDKLASEAVKQNIKNQYKRLLLLEKKKPITSLKICHYRLKT